MKRAGVIGGLALLCASAAVAPAQAEVSGEQRAQAAGRAILGTPAPRATLKTIDGGVIDLGALYGKQAVYLKFWATWCVPCREQMPHFEHVYETAGADLAVVAIDVGFNDSVEAIRAYRNKLGIKMPIVFDDGSLDAAFHLRVTPTHIVIGRDGRVLFVGHLADQETDAALIACAHGAACAGRPHCACADNGKRRPGTHWDRRSAAQAVPADSRWAALRPAARNCGAKAHCLGFPLALV